MPGGSRLVLRRMGSFQEQELRVLEDQSGIQSARR